MSSSLLDQTFEYCYAFFRQERNEVCMGLRSGRLGYSQRESVSWQGRLREG